MASAESRPAWQIVEDALAMYFENLPPEHRRSVQREMRRESAGVESVGRTGPSLPTSSHGLLMKIPVPSLLEAVCNLDFLEVHFSRVLEEVTLFRKLVRHHLAYEHPF